MQELIFENGCVKVCFEHLGKACLGLYPVFRGSKLLGLSPQHFFRLITGKPGTGGADVQNAICHDLMK